VYARSAFARGDRLFVLHGGYKTFDVFTVDPATGLSLGKTTGTLAVTGRTVGNLNYNTLFSQALPDHLILVGGNVASDNASIISFPLSTTIGTGTVQGFLPWTPTGTYGSVLFGDRLYMNYYAGAYYTISAAVNQTTGVVNDVTSEGFPSSFNASSLNCAPMVWCDRLYFFSGTLKVAHRLPNNDLVEGGTYGGLGTPRYRATGVMIGNRAWVIGGVGSTGGRLTSTEAFDVRDDGLHSASLRGPDLTTERENASAFTANGYLYVLGGNNGNALATIERAAINPDGSLGAFAPAGQMIKPRVDASVLQAGSYVFVFGGSSLNSVERAKIYPDGSLGPFEILSQSTLPLAASMKIARVGNRIHLLVTNSSTVYTTILDEARGLLGPYSTSPSLIGTPVRPNVTHFGNYLYCFGGNTTAIQRSALGPNGELSAWANAGTLPNDYYFQAGSFVHPRGILLFPYSGSTPNAKVLWAPSLY
jgi:hypothetical protein